MAPGGRYFQAMSKLEIRPTVEADLATITAIYAQAVREGTATFELEPPDLAEMTRRFRALSDGGFPYHVGVLDGQIAGYAYAGAYRSRPGYRYTVENSVYLHPSSHRRGIGRQLLQSLISESEARGFRQMIAVSDSANAASISVHIKCGFEMIGTHRNVAFKFGSWLHLVMMQLALGEGGATVPAK
jgi:L-amino acid N-acyltransferase YncA